MARPEKKKEIGDGAFPQSVHRLDSSLQRVRVRASLDFAVEYSKPSLRTGTPLGPALSVCLRERCQGGKTARINSRCPRESTLSLSPYCFAKKLNHYSLMF